MDQRTGRALSHGYEPVSGENLPAITLLDSAASMELSALQTLFPNVKVAGLPLIDWAQVGRLVYIPSWSAFAGEYGDLLAPYRVGDIPEVVANLGSFATRVRDPKGMLLTREQRAERCAALIWMAFVLALLNDGWQLQTEPGQFRVVRGETRLEPPDLVTRLRQGAMQAAEFHALAEGLEIDGLPLALTRRIGEFATTPSPWR